MNLCIFDEKNFFFVWLLETTFYIRVYICVCVFDDVLLLLLLVSFFPCGFFDLAKIHTREKVRGNDEARNNVTTPCTTRYTAIYCSSRPDGLARGAVFTMQLNPRSSVRGDARARIFFASVYINTRIVYMYTRTRNLLVVCVCVFFFKYIRLSYFLLYYYCVLCSVIKKKRKNKNEYFRDDPLSHSLFLSLSLVLWRLGQVSAARQPRRYRRDASNAAGRSATASQSTHTIYLQ